MYNSYQLFKATLQFLAGKQLLRPFLWNADDQELLSMSNPVFYDGVRSLDILFKMAPWSYHRLRNEAQTTLRMLNDSRFDYFESTFIHKSNEPLLQFDILLQIPLTSRIKASDDFKIRIYEVISRSLGNRAKLVTLSSAVTPPWTIQSDGRSVYERYSTTVGIVLDPEHVRRTVDHGPPAEDKEASAKFREFWGEKAELRRFKDGSILESLVWSGDGPGSPVVKQILSHAIERHLGKDLVKRLKIIGEDVDALLPNSTPTPETTASFQPLMEAFQALEKQLQEMESLPLSLRQLSAADSQLRYASLSSPGSTKMSTPADVVIQLEGSGRWPDDLAAAQQTKTAFLLKIGELLEAAVPGQMTKVGIENENKPLLNKSFLDIVYPTGASFRIRIHHDREQAFLDRLLKDKSTMPRVKEEAAHALAVYKRAYIQSPRHTQAVRTLCTRFPYLSPSIRLFKKWCGAHLLSNHFSEELMELFVIRVFVQPYPWDAPSSTMTGFLRTLHMLSHWDWQREPLIVDSSGSLTQEDVASMNTRFDAWRKIDPAMNSVVLFVASSLDPEGVTWTQGKPLKVVAGRLSGLAKATMKLMRQKGLELDFLDLFRAGLMEYDFVIHLKDKFVSGRIEKEQEKLDDSKFKNLRSRDTVDIDPVGYDPIRLFLDDLEQTYGCSIVFFYSGHGSSVIAGLWNPQLDFKPFRLKLSYSSLPLPEPHDGNGEPRVTINKPAILSEIAFLGGDMIEKIDVNRS
jgi:U3 small nucleolar RNA-associated protein 22